MSNSSTTSSDKGLIKTTGIVGISTLLSRILGMLRDSVTWAIFANYPVLTDAFYVAFRIPNLLRRLVAEGSLATAFVPIFTESLEKSKTEAQRSLSEVLSFCLILTLLLSVFGIVLAPQITSIFAPGFGANTEQHRLTVSLMRIMFPYIILVSVLALFSSVLNTLKRFFLPALAPAILNAIIVITLLVASISDETPIYQLAASVLVGGAIVLFPLIWQLKNLGFSIKPKNPLKSPHVKNLFLLMLPAIFSASLYQIMIFVNSMLASLLERGSISYLYYADRLFQFPLGVFTLALATAILPSLSRLAAQNNHSALSDHLSSALRWVSFITLPATAGLFILAEPICTIVYEWGNASADDSRQIASALRYYSLGLWAVSCQSIVVRTFIAKKNTLIPAAVACLSILSNCLLAIALMGPIEKHSGGAVSEAIIYLQTKLGFFSLGYEGLALAGSISSFIALILSLLLLPTINCRPKLSSSLICLIKSLLATGVMSGALLYTTSLPLPMRSLALVGIVVGLVSYFLAAKLLKIAELKEVLSLRLVKIHTTTYNLTKR